MNGVWNNLILSFLAGFGYISAEMSYPAFDRFHANPGNWKLGIFYFCREDRRILVPKRIRSLGWTINFARPLAFPFIAALLGSILGVREVLRSAEIGTNATMAILMLLALGIIVGCNRLANRGTEKE